MNVVNKDKEYIYRLHNQWFFMDGSPTVLSYDLISFNG